MFASVYIITETHAGALVVPKKALVLEGEGNQIFVYEKDVETGMGRAARKLARTRHDGHQATAELVADEPGRYLGVGTVAQVPPIDIMRAVGQVAACAELGFVGVSIQPAFFHTAIDDRRLYPVYAKTAELDLVAFVHTGINYGTTHPFGNDHPMLLDQIACDFPKLRIVAAHAGWPWTAEMVAVARKHANVYLEFGGLAPKYIAAPGSGWEVVYRFMNSVLQDQILFGTDWPAFEIGRALAEWRAMELKDTVRDKLLGGNAARLFGLE